jgi:hypothetical protein
MFQMSVSETLLLKSEGATVLETFFGIPILEWAFS